MIPNGEQQTGEADEINFGGLGLCACIVKG